MSKVKEEIFRPGQVKHLKLLVLDLISVSHVAGLIVTTSYLETYKLVANVEMPTIKIIFLARSDKRLLH